MTADLKIATDDAIRWLRTLPEGCAAAVVTDPPYCSGGFSEVAKRRDSSSSAAMPWLAGDMLGTWGVLALLRELAVECRRVVDDGSLNVFTDWRMVPGFAPVIAAGGWRWSDLIVWDKGWGSHGRGWKGAHELLLHFDTGATIANGHSANVLRFPRVPVQSRHHPTEKPVELLRAILRVVARPGDLIVDPFAGSGPIIEAARAEGMSVWCCDADPQWAPVMEERAAAHQPGLFGGES